MAKIHRKIAIFGLVLGALLMASVVAVRYVDLEGVRHLAGFGTKTRMCQYFAQTYLQTIQKTDQVDSMKNPDKWEVAVDIETEMYNLCLLDLNKKALNDYRTKAIVRYQMSR